MQDLLYLALMVLFTGVAALFVIGCDRIVGSDSDAMAESDRSGSDREEQRTERGRVP